MSWVNYLWLLLLALPAGLCAFLTFQLMRFGIWVMGGGSRVVVPWSMTQLLGFSIFANRRRTRDGSFLSVRDSGSCALVLWKRPSTAGLGPVLADAATGFSGIWAVAVDCSLEANGHPWVITSGEFLLSHGRLSGPHYAPLAACHGSAVARIDLAPWIDGLRIHVDLAGSIANPAIRHNGAAGWLSFFLGRTRWDRVNCSSLIGRAILRQPSAPFAQALREALQGRFTYGEITPTDLARAAAILGLYPEGAHARFRTVPIFRRRVDRRTHTGTLSPVSPSSEVDD